MARADKARETGSALGHTEAGRRAPSHPVRVMRPSDTVEGWLRDMGHLRDLAEEFVEVLRPHARWYPSRVSAERIMDLVAQDEAMTFIAWRAGRPVGFLLMFLGGVGLGDLALWIDVAYARPEEGPDVPAALVKIIDAQAIASRAQIILFESPRPGFERLARRWGFRPSSRVYAREVPNHAGHRR